MITYAGVPKTGEIVLIAAFAGKVSELRGAIKENRVNNSISKRESDLHEDLLWKYLSNSQKN